MTIVELSELSFKDRFKKVKDLLNGESEYTNNIRIVNEIFQKTISWFHDSSAQNDPNIISKLESSNEELPLIFETIYRIQEESVIKNLPLNERQRIFDESKQFWCKKFPDFKRICEVMQNFKTNELLAEYRKHSPPQSINDKAIVVLKKCTSFKVKFTKKIISQLKQHPDTPHIHYYQRGIYCINEATVKSFLKEYQIWNSNICKLWNEIYYLYQDFFHNTGYDRSGWNFFIRYPKSLNEKANQIEMLYEKVLKLLDSGNELISRHDKIVTLEYLTNASEMSLFEREAEILQMSESESSSDEQYCYVYTLECELFIFYVGIASNPKERFEQHLRGAFSDEAHLFKSKFIQKFHKEVRLNIVFEGTRRECKQFEKDFIKMYSPLGNMTEGGEG
jgi:predicted GIY-YIG superfamily endonuclease